MKLGLVVLTPGTWQGKVLDIKSPEFLVGRDPRCHLRPASLLISKRHCAVLRRDAKAFVRDFGSTNGTLLNNQPVQGEAELHHGDRLRIGPLLFEVRLEVTPAVNRPTPLPPTKTLGRLPAGDSEEDIAAMLLSLQDEDAPRPATADGSTIMEGMAPPEAGAPAGEADPKKEAPKPALPNTSTAAKAILERYLRRLRA